MISYRDILFRRWKNKPKDMHLRIEYTRYRNKVNKYINREKNNYRKQEIIACKKDIKKIWGKVNSWLGKNKTSLDEVIGKYLGRKYDKKTICDRFSTTFTQEIVSIKHNCTIKFLDRATYVKECNDV